VNKEAEEIRLDAPLGQLAGLRWGSQGAAPVLCLHGWLDNAASFLPLAEQLDGLDLVALDFAGHGHSDHRHHTARYYLTEYLWDVEAAMDALGWESCHLMGHFCWMGSARLRWSRTKLRNACRRAWRTCALKADP
jgi:pimeloyl-ACP methyl ester carboxylesterase